MAIITCKSSLDDHRARVPTPAVTPTPFPPHPAKHPNRQFLVAHDLEIWPMILKTIEHPFYATWSCVLHFVAIGECKLELQPGNSQFRRSWQFFVACDLAIWPMILENIRAPLLYYLKLCASFRSHRWIQIGVTGRKRSVENRQFYAAFELEIW